MHQTQQVLVIRLGQPVRVVMEPGLHFKLPLIDSIVEIDNRIISLESPKQEIILSDQRRLVVDAIARYKILRPLEFYQTVGSITEANSRLFRYLIHRSAAYWAKLQSISLVTIAPAGIPGPVTVQPT